MDALAIRRENFFPIVEYYPQFILQMKFKFWNQYSQHVYQPLMKSKKLDINYFKYRNDYNQCLFLKGHADNSEDNFIKTFVR